MADDKSAEPSLEGSAMSRERPAISQEQKERQGEPRPNEGGAGWASGESRAAGALVTNRLPKRQDTIIFCPSVPRLYLFTYAFWLLRY